MQMMSSVDVAAPATSTRMSVTVVERHMLWSGGIVKVSIPTDATDGVYEGSDGRIPFLQFSRTIKGGRVNCFVHTNDDSRRGKTVTAEVSVMCKKLSDGREFLFADFRPVESDSPITHRFAIETVTDSFAVPMEWLVFRTPAPLRGAILLAPPGSKMPSNGSTTTVSASKVAASAKKLSDDPVLDRLLSEGWKVETDDGGPVVKLFKMKGEMRRTMDHHRPKKWGKKK